MRKALVSGARYIVALALPLLAEHYRLGTAVLWIALTVSALILLWEWELLRRLRRAWTAFWSASRPEGSRSDATSPGPPPASPRPAPSPAETAEAKRSIAQMHLGRVSVFEDFSTIEAGKQLAFRAFFKNNGPLPIKECRIIIGSAIGPAVESPTIVSNLSRYVRSEIEKITKAPWVSTPIAIGTAAWKDVTSPIIGQSQVAGLMDGSIRIFLCFWIGWVGGDSLKGELEQYLYLTTPKEPTLSEDDLNDWGLCATRNDPSVWLTD